jgi:cytochrome c oxidase accessory protein FixG
MKDHHRVIPIHPVASTDSDEALTSSLYEVRQKIHMRAVHGWFAVWRWAFVWFTQLLFYGTAWLDWNGRQAVLFDLAERKFYIFGLVFWPQDFIYLAVLLVISALSLFLFTAVAGRLFCGYACPQTVYTEIFMWVEEKIEGDRNARQKLDASPPSLRKFTVRGSKHLVWIAIALWTGFTFTGYFTPIRAQMGEILHGALGGWQAFWILFYSFATYGNAGFMREQVCKYMCPYARFQSAMFDKDTLIITYDAERGEPRGSRSRNIDYQAAGLGSCIDCGLCVQVCPTGIDIRQGLQYECIGCAACIDACDQIMDKMDYPRGLIRYTTENILHQHGSAQLSRKQMLKRLFRPRVLAYSAVLWLIILAMLTSLVLRVPLKVDVLRDRGALGRAVNDGDDERIENIYRLQIMNTDEAPHRYHIRVDGLETLRVASEAEVTLESTSTRMVPVRVLADLGQGKPGSNKIVFIVEDVADPEIAVREASTFYVPR